MGFALRMFPVSDTAMLVYFALILITLIGFCGLAIDVGRMELRTNQLQAAADAGALAAAAELAHGGAGSNYQTAATNDIATYEAANGLPQTGTNAVVVGANYGSYANDNSTVQVTITQTLPTLFMGMITGKSGIDLTARAVAQMPPCLVFLGRPTYSGGSGLADVSLTTGGGIQTGSWGCPLYAADGYTVDSVSHIYGGQARSTAGSGSSTFGKTSVTPIYSVPTIADPLASISAPSVGTCKSIVSYLNVSSATTINLSSGTFCGKTNSSPTYVPGPGASCGMVASVTTPAIDIEGKQNGCPDQNGTPFSHCTTTPTVNFGSGTYVIVGGMNLDCVTVTGSGATLYFTKSSSVGYGQMRLTSSVWNVSAPTDASGSGIPGVVMMSDRNWSGGNQDFLFNYSTWNGDGVLYVTGTGIQVYDTPMSAPNYLNMVVSNLSNSLGEIQPSFNYANLSAGSPLRGNVSLVQ